MATMKRLRTVLAMVMLMALLAPALPMASLAQGPNIDCPAGTTLVAKFEWDDDKGYEFEKPEDNEGLVTIDEDADAQGGDWKSTVGIHYVIIKGATDTFTYTHTYSPCDPGELEGAFDADDFDPPHTGKDISNIQFCAPVTAITLVSFTARAANGGVTLAWETGTEIDNAGFNLYRATSTDGPYTQINDALIPAEGDAVAGASYTFLDTPGYGTFYYQLEDVDYYGVSTLHGPVEATVARPFRRPLRRPFVPY